MKKSIFTVSKMDCPSEEGLIKMKLDGSPGIIHLDFDLENRVLSITHNNETHLVHEALGELNFGETLIETIEVNPLSPSNSQDDNQQKKLLWTVLIINFSFFILELFTGIVYNSMGLLSDGLDMLADSFVYAISLFAVGGTLARKKQSLELLLIFK